MARTRARTARTQEALSGVMARQVEASAGGVADGLPTSGTRRTSFADVARIHLDRLYGFCVRLANDPTDAEDLVQETLLRAMRAYPALRDPDRARGWLFAIATNAWRDLGRARGREVRTVPFEGLDAEGDEFSLFQTIAIEDPFPYSDELHLDFHVAYAALR